MTEWQTSSDEINEGESLELVPIDVQYVGRMMYEMPYMSEDMPSPGPTKLEGQFEMFVHHDGALRKVRRVFVELEESQPA